MTFVCKVPAACATLLLLGVTAYAGPIGYSFQTYDNPADLTFNQLLGVNNGGLIVGYYGSGMTGHPNQGYTFTPPSSYTPENYPASAQTQVVGVNNSSVNVGFYADGAGDNFGFVDQGGTFTNVSDPLVPLGSQDITQLLGVSDNDIAAGFYVDGAGNSQGFTYNIAGVTFTPITLPGAFNAVSTVATGINDAGVVSGFYVDNLGATHGFIDDLGTFTSLDDPSANGLTMLLGLNNNGQVAGTYVDSLGFSHGLVFDMIGDTWQTVDDPLSSNTAAFGVSGTTVNGINDRGMLVGFYSDGTNVDGFEAAPIPEPASLGFVAIGLGLLGWRRLTRERG